MALDILSICVKLFDPRTMRCEGMTREVWEHINKHSPIGLRILSNSCNIYSHICRNKYIVSFGANVPKSYIPVPIIMISHRYNGCYDDNLELYRQILSHGPSYSNKCLILAILGFLNDQFSRANTYSDAAFIISSIPEICNDEEISIDTCQKVADYMRIRLHILQEQQDIVHYGFFGRMDYAEYAVLYLTGSHYYAVLDKDLIDSIKYLSWNPEHQ